MPSHLHEVLVELFRERPTFAAELLAGPLRVTVPTFQQARLSSADLTDVSPTEYRADAVVTLTDDDKVVLAVVIEAQLRPDDQKRRSWPAYVATLYARLGCPVTLLVVCPKLSVAAWCAVPIMVGNPGFVLTPTVLGPRQVPIVTDPVLAQHSPELAVLSAMAHGNEPEQKLVFDALLAALDVMDQDHANLYADVVLAVLPAAARDYLEANMNIKTYQYQSDFARRYFSAGEAQGEAHGEARAILAFLGARGIDVPDQVRETIGGCADLDQLETWIRRAATATTINDLFS